MPFTACCPGNVNRIMPNYVLSMYSLSGNTVTARMYGPSEYSGTIDGKAFSVKQNTTYPFSHKITFEVKTEAPLVFRARVPEWSKGAGKLLKSDDSSKILPSESNSFMSFFVEGNAEICIEFNADIVKRENRGGVYFERGPLVYSLGMKGERKTEGDASFPAYEMYANKKWNYAISRGGAPEFVEGSEAKWTLEADLPHINVTCREVTSWKLKKAKKIKCITWKYEPQIKTFDSEITLTPHLPLKSNMVLAEEETQISLYPYGACKLRMTVLPKAEK